jgi:hypothetical protein
MRPRFLVVVATLAASWMMGSEARAQWPEPYHRPPAPERANCPECERAAEGLRAAKQRVARSEAAVADLEKRIADLVETSKAAGALADRTKVAKTLGELNFQIEAARKELAFANSEVIGEAMVLAECNRSCREPKYPEPPATGDGAALCPKCLEAARRVANLTHTLALLRAILAGADAGFKKLDEFEARRLRSDLISYDKTLFAAENDLKACNESCQTSFFKTPTGIGTASAIVVGAGVLITQAGGGTPAATPPVVVSPPPAPTGTVPNPSPNPSPAPAPSPSPAPFTFTVTFTASGWDHVMPGQFSDVCGRFSTDPPQSGVAFSVTITGPAVSQGTVTGTTNSAGVGLVRARITSIGTYSFTVTVTVNSVTRTATGSVNVTSTAGTCPSG